jgi:hypothetical protein
MNAIFSRKVESTDMETNLATVSEVEAGIRDFVRKDVAHLRRPTSGGDSTEREPSAEATVNNVNSLIQRIAGTSRSQVETLVSELESLRDLLHAAPISRFTAPEGRRFGQGESDSDCRSAPG